MNILNDVKEMQNVSLTEVPFNDVDSLIFATLSYFPINTLIRPNEKKKFCDIDASKIEIPQDLKESYKARWQLMQDVLTSKRYADFAMSDFENIVCQESEKQFSAVCFSHKKFVYVSFRGTDGTLTGWKEDFNMAYMESVPAQIEALAYLHKVAKRHHFKKLILGGHSKGGNLAIYAATKSKWLTRRRIQAIFSHDGPGFKKEFFEQKGYLKIADKIHKTVPEACVIGMLLDNPYPHKIVASDGNILEQHNSLNWKIENHKFATAPKLDNFCTSLNQQIDMWLDGKSMQERKDTVDMVFDFIEKFKDGEIGKGKMFFTMLTNPIAKEVISLFLSSRKVGKSYDKIDKDEEKAVKKQEKQLAKQQKQEEKELKAKEKQEKKLMQIENKQ